MKIFQADPSEMMRIGELDRTEEITAKYRCVAADDQSGIQLQREEFDPPEIFPDWSEVGVKSRATSWREQMGDAGALFFAEENGRVVGVSVLSAKDDNDNGEVVALFIDRAYRGQGIGRKLMAPLEEAAREQEMESLYVYSNETVATVHFYQHLGYRIICLLDNTLLWLPWMGTSITLAKKL